MFKEDLKRAWADSIPVFVWISKVLGCMFAGVMWVLLNFALVDVPLAILALWVVTFVCAVVVAHYFRAVALREHEESMREFQEKRKREWEKSTGRPYPV